MTVKDKHHLGRNKTQKTWSPSDQQVAQLRTPGRANEGFGVPCDPGCPRDLLKGPKSSQRAERLPTSIPESTARPKHNPKKPTHFVNLDLCTGIVFAITKLKVNYHYYTFRTRSILSLIRSTCTENTASAMFSEPPQTTKSL
jgi:hypothetical protein